MQETGTGNVEAPPPARRALTPHLAAAIVAALAVSALGLTFLMSRERQDSSDEPGRRGTSGGPRDESVIAEFTKLSALAGEMFDARDATIAPSIYTDESPVLQEVLRSVRNLRKQEVADRGHFERLSIDVVSADSRQALLREVTLYYPCFMSRNGTDVTQGPGVIEQTNLYTLRDENGSWQIHDAVLERDRVVKKALDQCTTP
jgi:hypothetical protein